MERNDYYTFGKRHTSGRNYSNLASSPFLFSGKEDQPFAKRIANQNASKVIKTMKNIVKRLVFVLGIISIIPWGYLYYYYPREVKYESVFEINKPDSSFDRSSFIGFDYVNNKERLFFALIDRPVRDHPFQKAYDNAYIEYLSNMMDFDRYDYIITYQKELIRLQYSPYLRRINDDLYFDKRMPLIPTWNTDKTDKIYIYRIKKNKRFRAPGP